MPCQRYRNLVTTESYMKIKVSAPSCSTDMKLRRVRARMPVFAACLALLAATPFVQAELVRTLLSLAGAGTNSVCAFPRCGDGGTALGMATNASVLVHAMSVNPTAIASLRSQARTASAFGRSLYVEAGSVTSLPYASEMLDALFMTDLTDADLNGFPTAEVLRVLSPCIGRAVLGKATGTPGTLTRALLETWALQWGGPDAHVDENSDGLWAVITRPALAGVDNWTHPFHGPDNNPVAKDSAFTLPSAIAWLAKPYQLKWRNVGNRLIVDGRLYMAFGPNDEYKFRAFNVYNGSLLWERTLDTNTWAQRHLTACVRNDRVYLIQQASVAVLDTANGAEVDRITFTNVTGQGKWMAITSNLLVMLIGPMDIVDSGWLGSRNAMFGKRDSLDIGHGTLFVAYDLDARAERWRCDEGARVDARTVGISAGRLFYHAPTARAVCRDVMTGGLLWTNADAAVMALLDQKFGTNSTAWWGPSAAAGLEDRYSMLCTSNAVYIGRPEGGSFVALASSDGHLLWSRARSGGRVFNFVCCADDKLYVNGIVTGGLVNAMTGAFISNPGAVGGCGVATVNGDYLLGQIGGPGYDFVHARSLVLNNGSMLYPVKTECSMGGIVANGRYVSMAKACTCPVMRGSMGLCSGRTYPTPSGALQTGAGDYGTVLGLAADDHDWSTQRGTPQHNGAAPVGVATYVTNLWRISGRFRSQTVTNEQYMRNVQQVLTTPVTIGDLMFVCGSDGLVQCITTSTGDERWQFYADGPVLAAPTVADSRLLFGSADGYVYALEAATGRLLWRYRVGPEDRKIMVYGYLQSCWPVNSGVYAENGRVYVAAGLPMQPGAAVCALDEATGHLLWRNNAVGPRYDQANNAYGETTRTPNGYITGVNSTVWVKAFQAGIGGLAFNKFNGTNLADVSANTLRGRDIGVVSNNFLIWGGMDAYADTDERAATFSYCLAELSNGVPRKYGVNLNSLAMPAWTAERMIVAVRGAPENIECWSTPATLSYFSDLITKHTVTYEIVFDPPASNPPPMLLWRTSVGSGTVYAVALSANLVIAALVTNKVFYGNSSEFGGCLRAYDVYTGAQVWNISLPAYPVRNGVSIDRNGRVLVCLHDGSIFCYGGTNEPPRALLAEDGCASAAFGAAINGSGGGSGWSGAWRAGSGDRYDDGLVRPGWDARGLALSIVSNAARFYNGALGGSHGTTNWFSFLFEARGASQGQAIRWFSNGDADSGMGASIDGSANGSIYAALGPARAVSGATNLGSATHLILGTVVWSTNAGEDRISIWLDPTSWGAPEDIAPSASGASTLLSDAPARFDAAAQVYIANSTSAPGSSIVFDEIRLGTTLESVRPVPEPFVALGGLIAAAAVCRRYARI